VYLILIKNNKIELIGLTPFQATGHTVAQWLVAGLCPERTGFNPKPIHVVFVVDKVTMGQVLWFLPIRIIPPMHHAHSFICH
jgi:hypothetical protein